METSSFYHLYPDNITTSLIVNSWIPENQGLGVVLTPNNLPNDSWNLYSLTYSDRTPPTVSIVICTLDRPESLNETLLSLTKQTFQDFEIILITEKGDLSKCRDKGLRCAVGSIVSFIDDDVHLPTTWLEGVTKSFGEGVVGVTGPTVIRDAFRLGRDIFKYKRTRKLQDLFFGVSSYPGNLSRVGTPSMESNEESCDFSGEVDYLECCNMSVKKKEALEAGGFSHDYIKTSEWCELDLSLRLRKYGSLVFRQEARLYHNPSQSGVYKARLDTKHRWENFALFQRRWVKPSFKRCLYWAFVWTYFKLKGYGVL